ncbi:MAG: hypothetical protein ACRDHG_06195 [Anaerolineales bacterium]
MPGPRARKVDIAQPNIVAALRARGFPVVSLALCGQGIPDLLTATRDGRLVLLEVKSQPRAKLTPLEERFHLTFAGCPVFVVHTAAEALALVADGEARLSSG